MSRWYTLLLLCGPLVGCATLAAVKEGALEPSAIGAAVTGATTGSSVAGPLGGVALALAAWFVAAYKAGKKESNP